VIRGERYGLEQELGEENVAVGGAEVIKQDLRHFARVFKEAEDGDKHLNELDRRQFLNALHVLYAQRYTALTCNIQPHTHLGCVFLPATFNHTHT